MISLAASVLIFIAALAGHIASHRYVVSRGAMRFGVVYSYAVGLVIVTAALLLHMFTFPVLSLSVYILLSLVSILFYLTPFLGGETPASMILESFEKKSSQTYQDLRDLFTQRGLIDKRLEDLERAGMVVLQKEKYQVTLKGTGWMRILSVYETVFHRRLMG